MRHGSGMSPRRMRPGMGPKMRRALAAALCAGGLAAGTAAVSTTVPAPEPGAAARAAAAQLDQAARRLDAADSARDRVAALTETLRAYEAGLAAMREGLRRASLREAELAADLTAREGEIAQLLGVLQTIGRDPGPVMTLHPAGALGTVRSGMILADVTPALGRRADDLRAKLEEARNLRLLQESAAARLQEGLNGVQQARAELSEAMADRRDLPKRFTEDPIRTALLIASTETLEAFASGLTDIATEEAPGSLPDMTWRKGSIPLPVEGRILRHAGEEDAAGIARPGLVLATRPRALVTTPVAATIRYRGPLLDYGNVMILEPQAGTLFVLAGLDVVYGAAGQVLPAGSPVGLMGGTEPGADAILVKASTGSGTDRTETLYIEVRQGDAPENPETWFATMKDG